MNGLQKIATSPMDRAINLRRFWQGTKVLSVNMALVVKELRQFDRKQKVIIY